MDRESIRCCICLDIANVESIKLIGCGCQSAWFHQSCENNWISSIESPYKCPTCRRYVPLRTNYSFSPYAGPDQTFLWYTASYMILEFLICLHYNTLILSLQSLGILTIPYVIYSNNFLNYFLYNTILHIYYNIIIFVVYQNDSFIIMKNAGYLHILMIYILHFIQYKHFQYNYVYPLEVYAISREIIHTKELVAQSSTDTLKRPPSSRIRNRNRNIRK